jgi:PilZ domain
MKPTEFTDPRRAPREHVEIPIRYAIASENYGVEYEATTMDRSLTGFRIRTPAPLSSGETVVVLSLGNSQSAIPTRVAWVRDAELNFGGAAGLEILKSLPA